MILGQSLICGGQDLVSLAGGVLISSEGLVAGAEGGLVFVEAPDFGLHEVEAGLFGRQFGVVWFGLILRLRGSGGGSVGDGISGSGAGGLGSIGARSWGGSEGSAFGL